MVIVRKLVCQECDRPAANSNNVLARHVRNAHGIDWPDYVVKHEHGGTWPICACGCNERLMWRKGGFGRYIAGHETSGGQKPLAAMTIDLGWVVNPFTMQEEMLRTDDEVAFLRYCMGQNDPMTTMHGISIGWLDAQGLRRMFIPSFKHVEKNVLISFDDYKDPEGPRRWAAIKSWCASNGFVMLSLSRKGDGFDVINAFDGRKNGKT